MGNFQQQVEDTLSELFNDGPINEQEIKNIAEEADALYRTIESQPKYDFELTVEKIRNHLEKRKDGGPKWAWNNWIGTLEYIGAVPEGYQV